MWYNTVMKIDEAKYQPTLLEISAGCAQIQATWSTQERGQRRTAFADTHRRAASRYVARHWTPPTIRMADLPDARAR